MKNMRRFQHYTVFKVLSDPTKVRVPAISLLDRGVSVLKIVKKLNKSDFSFPPP